MSEKFRAIAILVSMVLTAFILVIVSVNANSPEPGAPYVFKNPVCNAHLPIWDATEFDEEARSQEDTELDPSFVKDTMYLKYTTEGLGCRGDCDFNAIYNVMRAAENGLWPADVDKVSGKTYYIPCGGGAMCREPYLAENVSCYVEKTDCNFGNDCHYHDPKVLTTYLLDCRGDRICGRGDDSCCIITKVIDGKVYNLDSES